MKDIKEYINEGVKQEFLDSLYNKLNIVGQLPNNVANILAQFTLRKIDENNLIELVVDTETKNIIFKNLKYLEGTINRFYKFFKTGYNMVFNENTTIYIGSGKSLEQSNSWPSLDWSSSYFKLDWWDILKYISDANPEHKFNKLILSRYLCDTKFPTKHFSEIKISFNELHFNQCRSETELVLPTKEEKNSWFNPNMKFSSSSKRAETYFAENDMLIGSEEEVKSHWRKSFAKEMEEKQRAEAKRQEKIKPTHDNPPIINTFENNWMYVDLSVNSSGSKACLEIQFSKGASGSYREQSFWDDHKDLVWVEGAYVNVNDNIWEITKITCEGGYWTSGRNIYDFYLKKV